MTQIKFSAIIFISLVSTIVCIDELVPVSIERQLRRDIVYFKSGRNESCNIDDKATYLVEEKKCVSNQKLLNGNHSLYTIAHV